MDYKKLKSFVKQTLNETVVEKTISRLDSLVEQIGEATTLDEFIRKMDDFDVNRILEQIESEYDLKPTEEEPTENQIGSPARPSNPGGTSAGSTESDLELDEKKEIGKNITSTAEKVKKLKAKFGNRWKDVVHAISESKKKKLAETEETTTESTPTAEDWLEFIIPNWAGSALINGDYSGLDDEDEIKLNKFIQRVVEKYGNANFAMPSNDEELEVGFKPYNDVDNLGSDCMKLLLLPSNLRKK